METGKDLILITGATGKQGGATARELLTKGHAVRAMTRRPDSAEAQALATLGAEIVTGDLDDADSLARAASGAWGVFAVQNTWEAGVEREEVQGLRLADVALKAGVQHFVYSSVGSAHRRTGIPHFENKMRVEQRVRSLGFPSFTILRPVFFMENLAGPWFLPGLQEGKLAMGIGPVTVLQMIAVRDIGKYGLWAFEHHASLNGRAIDIAGDQHTMPETARILGQAMGREVAFVQVPIEDVRAYSADYAAMLEWFDRVGYDADIAGRAKESGIRPTTLAEWAATVTWAPAAAAR
jgi:uncharacterized protein YbjT (DUF2867 family)